MAVTSTPKTTKAEPETVNLELAKVKRYYYADHLYVHDQVYVFSQEVAGHMLSLKDTHGGPVWMHAKPRTRLVQIPLDQREVKVKRVDRVITDVASFLTKDKLQPVGRIDLGDDDPEIAAKLKSIDSAPQEIDTADGGAVSV